MSAQWLQIILKVAVFGWPWPKVPDPPFLMCLSAKIELARIRGSSLSIGGVEATLFQSEYWQRVVITTVSEWDDVRESPIFFSLMSIRVSYNLQRSSSDRDVTNSLRVGHTSQQKWWGLSHRQIGRFGLRPWDYLNTRIGHISIAISIRLTVHIRCSDALQVILTPLLASAYNLANFLISALHRPSP